MVVRGEVRSGRAGTQANDSESRFSHGPTTLFSHLRTFDGAIRVETNSNDQPVDGQCDVLAFHPRHDLTLARLPLVDIARIMNEWIAVYKRRGTLTPRGYQICASL